MRTVLGCGSGKGVFDWLQGACLIVPFVQHLRFSTQQNLTVSLDVCRRCGYSRQLIEGTRLVSTIPSSQIPTSTMAIQGVSTELLQFCKPLKYYLEQSPMYMHYQTFT